MSGVPEKLKKARAFLRKWLLRRLFPALLGLLALGWIVTAPSDSPSAVRPTGEVVILLHGMGRSHRSMLPLAWSLRKAGFQVVNVPYPSTQQPIAALAEQAIGETLDAIPQGKTRGVHLVTHSLGGILVRQYAACHPEVKLGRVVMLAPPNQGSEVADHLRLNKLYRWTTGPAGQGLGTGAESAPNRLGPVSFDLGVIAGDRTLNPWFSSWIPDDDDGKVAVARTTVVGMKAHWIVHCSHTMMMLNGDVQQGVIQFLRHGKFSERKSATEGNIVLPPQS